MITSAFYYLFLIVELAVSSFILIYILSMLLSFIKGAPYVSTATSELNSILENAHLKPHQYLLELGCGDGRLLRQAALSYGIKGLGVDINPLLIYLARLRASWSQAKNLDFAVRDVFQTDFSQADVIYLYLFPELILKLKDRFLQQTKSPVLIISHGFTVPYLENYLIITIIGRKLKTYYYRLIH